jgi:hypothetical protein
MVWMRISLTVWVVLALLALAPATLYAQQGGWGQPQPGQGAGQQAPQTWVQQTQNPPVAFGQPGQMPGQQGQMPGMGMGMPGMGMGMGMGMPGMGMTGMGMNPMVMMGSMGRSSVAPVMLVNDGIIYIAYDGKLTAFDAKTLERVGEATYWERPDAQGAQPGGLAMPGAGPAAAAPDGRG